MGDVGELACEPCRPLSVIKQGGGGEARAAFVTDAIGRKTRNSGVRNLFLMRLQMLCSKTIRDYTFSFLFCHGRFPKNGGRY